MTIEPDIDKHDLIQFVRRSYGLEIHSLRFLPIGFDSKSFSFECFTSSQQRLYLKFRLGEDISGVLSASLWIASHVDGAIHPLQTTTNGSTWAWYAPYKLMVFPFVSGRPGWDVSLSDDQWELLGRTVRSLHDLVLPQTLIDVIPRETFSDKWRLLALGYLSGETRPIAGDIHSVALQSLLERHQDLIHVVIDQAETLAAELSRVGGEYVCCHGDIHSGNFIVTDAGLIHPVDWDNISMAPREKDLMFVGGGIGGMLDGDDTLGRFASGYGAFQVNRDALRYFRLERIVQDVVAFCDQLLSSPDGGEARAEMYAQIAKQFEPGGVVEVALAT